MRILLVSTNFNKYQGRERYTLELVKQFIKEHEVHLLTANYDYKPIPNLIVHKKPLIKKPFWLQLLTTYYFNTKWAQRIKKEFNIVPIVIGDQSAEFIQDLSNVLAQIYDGRIILIISSDLSHFHSKKKAFELDKIVVDRINNMEFPELYNDLANNNCEACGGGGIVALLECADIIGDYKAEVLSHTDSGDVSNDNSSVVGYLSAVIYSN